MRLTASCRSFLILLAIFSSVLILPSGSYAALKDSIELSPAFIDIDSVSLDKAGYPVELTNNNKENLVITTRYVPFVPSKKNDGTLEFLPDEKSILKNFLPVSQDKFEIRSGETKVINILPNDQYSTLLGDYYEALMFYFTTSTFEPNDQEKIDFTEPNASINSAVAVPIFVRNNPKAVANYVLKTKNPPRLVEFGLPASADMFLENMGNTYGVPRGEVEIRDFLGRLLVFGNINDASKRFLPASGRPITSTLKADKQPYPLFLGTYSVRIRDDRSKDRAQVVYSKSFVGIDPLFLIGFVTGVIVIYSIKIFRYGKRAESKR